MCDIFLKNIGVAEPPKKDQPNKREKGGKIIMNDLGSQGVDVINSDSDEAHAKDIHQKRPE